MCGAAQDGAKARQRRGSSGRLALLLERNSWHSRRRRHLPPPSHLRRRLASKARWLQPLRTDLSRAAWDYPQRRTAKKTTGTWCPSLALTVWAASTKKRPLDFARGFHCANSMRRCRSLRRCRSRIRRPLGFRCLLRRSRCRRWFHGPRHQGRFRRSFRCLHLRGRSGKLCCHFRRRLDRSRRFQCRLPLRRGLGRPARYSPLVHRRRGTRLLVRAGAQLGVSSLAASPGLTRLPRFHPGRGQARRRFSERRSRCCRAAGLRLPLAYALWGVHSRRRRRAGGSRRPSLPRCLPRAARTPSHRARWSLPPEPPPARPPPAAVGNKAKPPRWR